MDDRVPPVIDTINEPLNHCFIKFFKRLYIFIIVTSFNRIAHTLAGSNPPVDILLLFYLFLISLHLCELFWSQLRSILLLLDNFTIDLSGRIGNVSGMPLLHIDRSTFQPAQVILRLVWYKSRSFLTRQNYCITVEFSRFGHLQFIFQSRWSRMKTWVLQICDFVQ